MSIKYDSRKVKLGDVFLAMPGLTVDGRAYIQQALDRGAFKVFYEKQGCEQFTLPDSDVPLIARDNLVEHQGYIAAEHFDFPSRLLKVIGITGTNGKTSISFFIAQCLAKTAVLGTLGFGPWDRPKKLTHTTPMAPDIQNMMRQFVNNKVAFVAMEVSSHALSQGRVNGTEFDIAVFTNLTQDHLDYHGDMARYAAAKKRLFDCDTLRGGVVNIDDPIGQEIVAEKSSRYTMITYAMHQPADVMAHDIQCVEAGFKVDVETPWGRSVFDVPLLGHFNIYNCLAVIGVLGLLQVPFESMPSLIAQLQPPPGRMEVYSTPDSATIVVDFAHTPDALKQALLTLRSNCDGRLVCVFGCGGDRDQDKRIEMGRVASALCDGVIVTNDNPRNEDPRGIADAICEGIDQNKLMCIELDRRLAIRKAITLAGKDDLILIAGKGFESEQIIGDKVLPFNDGIVVKETLDL